MPFNALENLTSEGFLLLNISENAQEKIRAIFDAAPLFFQEDFEQKILNRLPEDMGYRPYGIEDSRSPSYPDQVESFSVSAREHTRTWKLHSANAQILLKLMLDAFGIFESSAEAIAKELANALGSRSAAEKLNGAFHRWSRLQINYSRPKDVVPPLINELHEDGDLLTITCVTAPGLEVQIKKRRFKPIIPTPGELLVMPGEIAWLLSGGRVRPLNHRVKTCPQISERMALIFFGDIDPGCCEPWIINEINSNVDIGARVLVSVNRFGLKGFSL